MNTEEIKKQQIIAANHAKKLYKELLGDFSRTKKSTGSALVVDLTKSMSLEWEKIFKVEMNTLENAQARIDEKIKSLDVNNPNKLIKRAEFAAILHAQHQVTKAMDDLQARMAQPIEIMQEQVLNKLKYINHGKNNRKVIETQIDLADREKLMEKLKARVEPKISITPLDEVEQQLKLTTSLQPEAVVLDENKLSSEYLMPNMRKIKEAYKDGVIPDGIGTKYNIRVTIPVIK